MSSSVVFDLERKNVILAKKVVLESDKLRKLEQKIEEVTLAVREAHGKAIRDRRSEDPADFLARLGSGSAVQDMQKKEIREIRVLEKEKERQTRMFDLLEAQCGALREEIDAFRRDAMGQHERFDGFSRDLERVKLEMVRSLELAHQFDLEGKQIKDNMRAMQEDADKEVEELQNTHPHLFSTTKSSLGSSKKKGDLGAEIDVGTAGLTPGQRLQRRMKELNIEASRLLAEGESRRTQIEKYELHFEALRRCTKMSNIADMVKLFAEREDAKLRKMKLVQDLNEQSLGLEAERRAIVAAQEEFCLQRGASDDKVRARVADLQSERNRLRDERDALVAAMRHADADVEQVASVLNRLFYKLEVDKVGVEAIMNGCVPHFGKTKEDTDAERKQSELLAKRIVVDPKMKRNPYRLKPVVSTLPQALPASPMNSKGLAEAEMAALMKSGATKENISAYISLVEHRVVSLLPELTRVLESRGTSVQPSALHAHSRVVVSAPAIDTSHLAEESVGAGNLLSTLDAELVALSRSRVGSPSSPAVRARTSVTLPRVESEMKRKEKDAFRVASRFELQQEVHKEFGTADLTKFIRSVEDVDETDSDGGTGSGSWPAKNKSRRQEGTGSKRPISQPNSTSRK